MVPIVFIKNPRCLRPVQIFVFNPMTIQPTQRMRPIIPTADIQTIQIMLQILNSNIQIIIPLKGNLPNPRSPIVPNPRTLPNKVLL